MGTDSNPVNKKKDLPFLTGLNSLTWIRRPKTRGLTKHHDTKVTLFAGFNILPTGHGRKGINDELEIRSVPVKFTPSSLKLVSVSPMPRHNPSLALSQLYVMFENKK